MTSDSSKPIEPIFGVSCCNLSLSISEALTAPKSPMLLRAADQKWIVSDRKDWSALVDDFRILDLMAFEDAERVGTIFWKTRLSQRCFLSNLVRLKALIGVKTTAES